MIDLDKIGTDELIKRFIKGATDIGHVWDGSLKLRSGDPTRQAIVAEMQAIGEELRKRMPIEKIRALYDHESVAVRFWAAAQFMSIDPDWCEAAWGAMVDDISTKDAMALRIRAQTLPPKTPTLQELTDDQLVARFEDACMRRYGARFLHDPDDENGGPDIETKNRIVTEIARIVVEIKARDALPRLIPFMDSTVGSVRYNAAAYCLPIATERALAVLKQFDEDKSDEHHMDAWTILGKWERGTYGTAKW